MDYEFTIKALEGEIYIDPESITILAGIYEIVPGLGIKLNAGNSVSFSATSNTGLWTIETEYPFQISSSKLGFLDDGNFTMIKLDNQLERKLGDKRYELKIHLGNVHAVITDRKLQVEDTNNLGTVNYYTANVISYTDYYPGGMIMPNRSFTGSEVHRYGFQNQEIDNEIKGNGNSVNYKYRMHDPRIMRFFATDPLEKKYPYLTPYQFSSNQPIHAPELEGLESGNELGPNGTSQYSLGLTYSFGNKENRVGVGFKGSYQSGSNAINYELGYSKNFVTMGTGRNSNRFSANLTLSVGLGENTSYDFGSTLYLNNDGTSQRTGNIGVNSGDFSMRFEDDFIPMVLPTLYSVVNSLATGDKFKLYYNPLLGDGRDRFNSAHLDLGYNGGGVNANIGALVITGEPKATSGNRPGFLGTAVLDQNERVVMGQLPNLGIGIGYGSFGLDSWSNGSLYKPQLTMGYDHGVIQNGFQNGFHKLAKMNILNIVPNEKRMQKESFLFQFGTNFGYQ